MNREQQGFRRLPLQCARGHTVAQVSKPAVSRVSKPAACSPARPIWKSAIQQTWKSALLCCSGFRLCSSVIQFSRHYRRGSCSPSSPRDGGAERGLRRGDSGIWKLNQPPSEPSLVRGRRCDSQQHGKSPGSACPTITLKMFAAAGHRPALRSHFGIHPWSDQFSLGFLSDFKLSTTKACHA